LFCQLLTLYTTPVIFLAFDRLSLRMARAKTGSSEGAVELQAS